MPQKLAVRPRSCGGRYVGYLNAELPSAQPRRWGTKIARLTSLFQPMRRVFTITQVTLYTFLAKEMEVPEGAFSPR